VLSSVSRNASFEAPGNVLSYYEVVKRPVSLVLTNSTWNPRVEVLEAVEDAYVNQNLDEETCGSLDPAQLGVGYFKDQWGNFVELRTFVKFDQPTITSIFDNSEVLSARVKLYYFEDRGWFLETRQYAICPVFDLSWTENTITWANQPEFGPQDPARTLLKSPTEVGWWTWDVTEVASFSSFVIVDKSPAADHRDIWFNSTESVSAKYVRPVLEITYVPKEDLPVRFEASLVDGATGLALSDAPVDFYVGYEPSFTNSTDTSGVAVFEWGGPSTSEVYQAYAQYWGNATHDATNAFIDLDFRTPTWLYLRYYPSGSPNFVEIGDNQTINVMIGEDIIFHYWPWPPGADAGFVDVYVNGIWKQSLDTDYFHWSAGALGVYYINVSYAGSPIFPQYQLSDIVFAALAQAGPVNLYFEVDPSFEAGDTVDLTAKVVDAKSGGAVGNVRVEFWEDGSRRLGENNTRSDGVTGWSWAYPADGGAHTIMARVAPGQDIANVTLATQPVTLTVGKETKLLLWVERGSANLEHTFYAKLVEAKTSAAMPSQIIKLDINGTVYNLPTNQTGLATKVLWLEVAAYQVQALFEGTNPQSVNVTAKNPYGEPYPACTTIQYDFKPSMNSTVLTVEPQATQALTTTKTLEQLRQEAEQSTSVRPEHSFSPWYPWYRFHLVYFLGSQRQFDVGMSPLPGANIISALEEFKRRIERYMQDIVLDVMIDYILGETVALAGAVTGNPLIWAGMAFTSFWIKWYLLYIQSWDSIEKLRTSYVAQWISIMIEAGTFICEFALGHLLKIAQGLVKITFFAWSIFTIIANLFIDIGFFISQIDGRLAQLGGQ